MAALDPRTQAALAFLSSLPPATYMNATGGPTIPNFYPGAPYSGVGDVPYGGVVNLPQPGGDTIPVVNDPNRPVEQAPQLPTPVAPYPATPENTAPPATWVGPTPGSVAPIPSGSVAPPAPKYAPFNFTEDDIHKNYLWQLGHNAATRGRGSAASQYLSALEQALLGYGSHSLAQQTLDSLKPELEGYIGHPIDTGGYLSSLDAAQPLSTLGQIAQMEPGEQRNTNEKINLANVWYGSSGARLKQQLAQQETQRRSGKAAEIQQQLGVLGNAYLDALNQAQSQEDTGAQNAYNALIAQAQANPGGLGSAPKEPGSTTVTTKAPTAPGVKSVTPTPLTPWAPNITSGPVAPQTIPYLSQGYGFGSGGTTRPLRGSALANAYVTNPRKRG